MSNSDRTPRRGKESEKDAGSTEQSSKRHLRACLVCAILQPVDVFKSVGCPNCNQHLQLRGDHAAIKACTSKEFSGVIAVGKPRQSPAAYILRLEQYITGCYAVRVYGTLPSFAKDLLEDGGVAYIARDHTFPEVDQIGLGPGLDV
ncbi:Spt4/RpoE2 zinc finger-domain-containing protein [Xylariaceae sp. FL0016]|nr:Spt4/RpoE2 zinc finger-domain-containing protein [Xylariaceae sp. FL0016]